MKYIIRVGFQSDENPNLHAKEILSAECSNGIAVPAEDLLLWFMMLHENVPDGFTEKDIVVQILAEN